MSSIKKFEKQFTISSLLKKKFIWPHETNQDHRGDLREQSAMCQIWLMCPFRNLTGDLIPTRKIFSRRLSCWHKLWKDFSSQLFLILPLNWGDFFFCPIPCFVLIWIALSWPKDVIYDRTQLLPFKISDIKWIKLFLWKS